MRLLPRSIPMPQTLVVFAAVASLFFVAFLNTVQAADAESNLALGKPVTASSVQSSEYLASYAVDGNTATRWSSKFSDSQWLYVDLGNRYSINRVVLKWEAAYAKSYDVQTSNDGSNWTTVKSVRNGKGGTDDLSVPGTTGRYVRINGSSRSTIYGYSLWEFQVYGPATAVPAGTPAPTATQPPSNTPAPTATSKPPISATATAVPPAATAVPPTATPVPPTATVATTTPPTATAIPPTPTASATPVPSVNVATGRTVSASSVESPDHLANFAVDGATNSRWSSAYSDAQWIYVDLGQVYSIKRVLLNWEAAYAKSYQIQVSNDASSWSTIYSTSSADGSLDDLTLDATGRYVMMNGIQRGTPWGYSLWEMEVYGSATGAAGSAPVPTAPPTATATPAPVATPVPASGGPILWGAYINGVPWDTARLAQFEGWAGKGQSIVHWGQPWQNKGVYQNFTTPLYEQVRQHGSIPMVNWGSWNLGSGMNQPNFKLADIANGSHDAYITQWATAAKAWGKPFFLRFNHEMNGNWFPWSDGVNGNQAGDFVRAWRHVHDIFTAVGATNVKWVWTPNIIGPTLTPLAQSYPGDGYVDWVGMDGYNWAGDRNEPWQSFTQVMGPTYDALLSLAPSKPIMVGETGTSEDGGPLGRPASKAAWIEEALSRELPGRFPRIRALVWFNWNDGDPNQDWPIESSQASIDAFARGIGSAYYSANSFSGASSIPQ